MMFWGLSFVWSKVVFKYYDPITTIILRLIISSILLFATLYIFYPKEIKKIDKNIKWFFLMAFFEPFMYFIGESFGLLKVDATFASVIISTIPVFTAAIGFYFLKEKLTFINFLGIVISCSGVIIMMLNNKMQFNAPLDGVLLIFLAVASAVGYGVIMKKISLHYHPIYIIAIQNLIGVILFLPLFAIFGYQKFITVTPNFELISSLLMLSVLASSIAFILYTYVVRDMGIAKANIFTNLIPIFTAIASLFILNEQFTLIKIIGITIVISGVYLSQRHVNKKREVI